MKIAIIGANSFLGLSIYKSFLHKVLDLEIHFFGSKMNSNIKQTKSVFFHQYIYPSVELDHDQLSTMDAIFFCSAAGVQSGRKVEETLLLGLNTFEPIQLSIELERRSFTGKFITFGSYFEIGENQSKKKFNEEDVVSSFGLVPNLYCSSKRMLTRYFTSKSQKIDWFHFILPSIYGENEDRDRLIPYLVNSIFSKKEVSVTSGTQLRQYIYIDDVTELLLKVVKEDHIPSIYNISPDGAISVKEVIEKTISSTGREPAKLTVINKADQKMKLLHIDNSKAKAEFQWEPEITLDEGIRYYIKKYDKGED